jgi:sporulation protein YlmC with PRC-barrel domain
MYERREEHTEERGTHEFTRLSGLRDWKIAEGEPDIRGWKVTDKSDKEIGKIDDLLVNTDSGEAAYAIVEYGGFLGLNEKKTLIPLNYLRISRADQRVIFPEDSARFKDAPEYRDDVRDYNQFSNFWTSEKVGKREHEMEHGKHDDIRERRRMEARERGHEIDEKLGQAGVGRGSRMRIVKQEPQIFEGIEEGKPVVREGETVEIPIIGERQVVTGKVIVEPETMEEEEEENQ